MLAVGWEADIFFFLNIIMITGYLFCGKILTLASRSRSRNRRSQTMSKSSCIHSNNYTQVISCFPFGLQFGSTTNVLNGMKFNSYHWIIAIVTLFASHNKIFLENGCLTLHIHLHSLESIQFNWTFISILIYISEYYLHSTKFTHSHTFKRYLNYDILKHTNE